MSDIPKNEKANLSAQYIVFSWKLKYKEGVVVKCLQNCKVYLLDWNKELKFSSFYQPFH